MTHTPNPAPRPRGLIKICGLKTAEMLDVALEAGADMVGLVFFEKSPRHVDVTTARLLADRARGRAEIVALVVDPTDEALRVLAGEVGPDLLQLHGRETPERSRSVAELTGLPVMKAIGISTASDLAAIGDFRCVRARILLDAKPPKDASRPGGNGRAFDWHLLESLDPAFGFMLSGGLDPSNVAQAIGIARPGSVDVSSGVESAPGQKDRDKILAFVAAAREGFSSLEGADR